MFSQEVKQAAALIHDGAAETEEIRCLMFLSVSAGNDEQVILHDVERGETLNVFLHDDAVYGLSVSPVNDNVFASSSDDGRVLIWDTREPPHGGKHK